MTGYLEESPGVKSMSRLAIAVCLGLAAVLVGTITLYALRDNPDAGVIGALAGALCTVVVKAIAALVTRNGKEADEKE